MLKVKFDLNLSSDELTQALNKRFSAAVSSLSTELASKGRELAASKLKSGLKHWNAGFKTHKISDNFYIFSLEGKLANWMEDGIQVGEISKAIMSGNRAKANKGVGKNYVDVPHFKDADAAGMVNTKASKVHVSAFKDADALTKAINFSDWKNGGIKTEPRMIARVGDVIKSTSKASGKTAYLTIHRVNAKSVWPKSPYSGVKVFENLSHYIDENFGTILEKVFIIMGCPISEFVIESVLRDALGAIRANPSAFDDLFSKFKETYFINQFGQTQINRLKTYIQNNQIRIVQSWSLVPTSMPCISIELLRASEDEDIQQFSMGYEEVDTAKTPAIKVPIVTPGTYDTLTGKLTITNAADLSNVAPGMNFVDFSGIKFEILSGNSNLSGDKYINIGSGQTPNLSGDGRIESWINIKRMDRRMIRLREQLRIGCHSKDDLHLTKYMYYLLIYILKSRQTMLIDRGINLDRTLGEVFDRSDEFQGENVYSRFIEFFCITEFDWDQAEVNLIDCFDLTVKAPMPNADSPTAQKVNTSDD